jgi:glycosyltransferase involved in cell wall biosynthesis
MWRMMVAARSIREVISAFFLHLFAYQRVIVAARNEILRGRKLMKQSLVEDGLSVLTSLAYGPAVASWIRREALKELLLWALASNNSALAESTANHLSGGFGFKTYRRPAHRELEHLLEHYSREQNWSAADGYRAFLNIKVRPFTQDAYAAANFGFGLPRDIFGDKVIRHMQLLWLNHILKLHELSQFEENLLLVNPITIDDLGKLNHETAQVSGGPLVSIVVPVFNGEQWLGTALDGLVKQTYRNIEILVVDDKSTDGTRELVRDWVKRDSRVRLIEQKVNGGSYRARNTGLEAATGEFVTVHDADDWSHPAKVQMQVEHLQSNPAVVANMSPGVRVEHERFHFYPVGGHTYDRRNLSSMMFRRELIRRELGFWDEVRFGADSEFFERLQARFGRKSVRDIKAGPLSFTRLHSASLTGGGYSSTATGINGIRRYYTDAYAQWHQAIRSGKAKALIGRESVGRPFAVPLLLSKRDAVLPKFDLVLHADLGANSGDLSTVFAAIAAAADASGKRLALIHRTTNRDYPSEVLDEGIRAKLDFAAVTLLIPGDSASAKLVRVLHPELLAALPAKRPALKAEAVELVGGEGIDAATAEALAKREFGGRPKWVR